MAELGCLFCDVVSGKEKSWVVYRDRRIMAILDPYPTTRGHTLIIPIRHYESMFDIPDQLLRGIVSLARKLSNLYEATLEIQGVSIDVLNHKKKTPTFRHFHMHVIPRYAKNSKRDPANVKPSQRFPWEPDRSLDLTLDKIRTNRKLLL